MKKSLLIAIFSAAFTTSALADVTWTQVGNTSYTQYGSAIRNNNTGETYSTLNGTTLGPGGQNYQTYDRGSYSTTIDTNTGRSCTDWGSSVGVVCN